MTNLTKNYLQYFALISRLFFISGGNGKENKLRKTRQKKIHAQEAKEKLALKESKVKIITKGKISKVNAKSDDNNVQDSNQKNVEKTKTNADSKYDISKIAKEINLRQTRQKQSSIENSEVIKKFNVDNIKKEMPSAFEDSKTNSANEINFQKTRQNKNTVEKSKAIKKSKQDIIKQDINKKSSVENSKADVKKSNIGNIKQEISSVEESKTSGSNTSANVINVRKTRPTKSAVENTKSVKKSNTIKKEISAVEESKNADSKGNFNNSTKDINFTKKTGSGARQKKIPIENFSSKADVQIAKANPDIVIKQEIISASVSVDAENSVKLENQVGKTAKTNKTQCYICGQLTSNSNIKGHMKGFHGEYSVKMHGPTKGSCPFKCGYETSNTDDDNLKEHIEQNHKKVDGVKKDNNIVSAAAAKHACNVCNETFADQKIMKRHFRQKHLSVKSFSKS